MSDDTTESGRPDFEERLRQVKRRQQERARQASASGAPESADELAGTALGVTPDKGYQRRGASQPEPGNGPLDDLWMRLALGFGGGSLVLVLVLAAVLSRHNTQIAQLQESQAYLEEQVDHLSMPEAEVADSGETAQLLQRLEGLERRDDRLPALEQRLGELEKDLEKLQALPAGDRVKAKKDVSKPRSETRVSPSSTQSGAKWYIVLSSFRQRDEAGKLQQKVEKMGLKAHIQPVSVKDQQWYRVRVGPYATVNLAKSRGEKLKTRLGLGSV